MSPQLSCGNTCEIWTWYSIGNQCFDKGEKSGNSRNGGNWFSNPHPWARFSQKSKNFTANAMKLTVEAESEWTNFVSSQEMCTYSMIIIIVISWTILPIHKILTYSVWIDTLPLRANKNIAYLIWRGDYMKWRKIFIIKCTHFWSLLKNVFRKTVMPQETFLFFSHEICKTSVFLKWIWCLSASLHSQDLSIGGISLPTQWRSYIGN